MPPDINQNIKIMTVQEVADLLRVRIKICNVR